ncbi:hypothetical protein ROJ8625_02753 [Roseivivax jejudonensis]|uniref:Uncharacterized protein n=1 Tax=Roseivivax jejudonensis TaxID=1529041 RepID=A0A1X6ZK54_9RHOB|nr:hypothetical protein [Roseivivax jejudonensis]SLN53839.1 hypothetical protein ROJ8625_02753 [Roseivivax jejudonensis]
MRSVRPICHAAAILTLVAVGAAPAAAQMSDEAAQIRLERFAPNVDVSQLSRAEILSLLNVIHSGGSRSTREAKVESLARLYQSDRRGFYFRFDLD